MARALKRPSTSVNEKDNIKVAKPSISTNPSKSPPPVRRRQTAPPGPVFPPAPPPSSPPSLQQIHDKYEDDIYKYLIHREKKFQIIDKKFLENASEVTSKMRRILIDWMIQVHSKFELTPETLHLSVNIVDRMLELRIIDKQHLQLLGISAMFVATKYEEIDLPTSYDYECITGHSFNKTQILSMETTILNALEFDISAPSSLSFSRFVSNFLQENNQFFNQISIKNPKNLSILLVELAMMDSTLVTVDKSKIASASWILGVRVLEMDGVDKKKVEKAVIDQLGASEKELMEVVELLAQAAYRHFQHPKLLSVKKKYQSTKYGEASNLLTDEVLEKLNSIGERE